MRTYLLLLLAAACGGSNSPPPPSCAIALNGNNSGAGQGTVACTTQTAKYDAGANATTVSFAGHNNFFSITVVLAFSGKPRVASFAQADLQATPAQVTVSDSSGHTWDEPVSYSLSLTNAGTTDAVGTDYSGLHGSVAATTTATSSTGGSPGTPGISITF